MKNIYNAKESTANEASKDVVYDKIRKTIDNWPDWKKQAYNDNFAVSKYSEKYVISEK